MSFLDEKESKGLFYEFPFYNTFTEIVRIKCLKNIDLLHGLPFYNELSKKQISKAFKRSYKIEIIDSKDLLVQLKASKSSIKHLFKELLDEIRGLNHQITVNVVLKNIKKMDAYNLLQFILILLLKQ